MKYQLESSQRQLIELNEKQFTLPEPLKTFFEKNILEKYRGQIEHISFSSVKANDFFDVMNLNKKGKTLSLLQQKLGHLAVACTGGTRRSAWTGELLKNMGFNFAQSTGHKGCRLTQLSERLAHGSINKEGLLRPTSFIHGIDTLIVCIDPAKSEMDNIALIISSLDTVLSNTTQVPPLKLTILFIEGNESTFTSARVTHRHLWDV